MTAAPFDADHPPGDDRLLPWPKVRDLTGISRTTAWRLQKAGDFPPPVVISPGRVGWHESEIQAWKASRAPRAALPPKQEKSFLPFSDPGLATAAALTLPLDASTVPTPRPRESSTLRNRRKGRSSDSGQITFDFG